MKEEEYITMANIGDGSTNTRNNMHGNMVTMHSVCFIKSCTQETHTPPDGVGKAPCVTLICEDFKIEIGKYCCVSIDGHNTLY